MPDWLPGACQAAERLVPINESRIMAANDSLRFTDAATEAGLLTSKSDRIARWI